MESPCKLGYQFILDIVLCFEHNKREGLRRTSHKEIPDHICMYYYKSSENPPNLLTRLQNLLQQTSIAGKLQALPQAPRPISLHRIAFFLDKTRYPLSSPSWPIFSPSWSLFILFWSIPLQNEDLRLGRLWTSSKLLTDSRRYFGTGPLRPRWPHGIPWKSNLTPWTPCTPPWAPWPL